MRSFAKLITRFEENKELPNYAKVIEVSSMVSKINLKKYLEFQSTSTYRLNKLQNKKINLLKLLQICIMEEEDDGKYKQNISFPMLFHQFFLHLGLIVGFYYIITGQIMLYTIIWSEFHLKVKEIFSEHFYSFQRYRNFSFWSHWYISRCTSVVCSSLV